MSPQASPAVALLPVGLLTRLFARDWPGGDEILPPLLSPRGWAKRVARATLPRSLWEVADDFRYQKDDKIWGRLAGPRQTQRLAADTIYSRTDAPFGAFDASTLSPTVASSLCEPWRSWEQRESVSVHKGDAFIEPEGGWIIRSPLGLVESCLIDSPFARRPSFRRYLRTRLLLDGPVREERRVIHLRDWGEGNYWHFLNDILGGRVRLAETHGLTRETPLLIGKRAFERPFVQEILRSTHLGRSRIIVQADEFLRCQEVVYFETLRHSVESLEFVLSCLQAPGGDPSGNKRVFLTRGRHSKRGLSNVTEIEDVCRQSGFEIVEPETLTLREQMKLFSTVRYLVAVHGAALANLCFRRGAPLRVLEIFPAWKYTHRPGIVGPPPAHYFWLAHTLGFRYDAMCGTGLNPQYAQGPDDTFEVDPELLEQKILEMMRSER